MFATTSSSSSSSSLFLLSHTHYNFLSTHKPKRHLFHNSCNFSITHNSFPSYSPSICPLTLSLPLSKPIPIIRNLHHWRTSASSQDISTEEIVSSVTKDDGVSNVVSILLFIAFIGLSILTIGVIYIGVTDFLQKREKDKFEKEEAANKKKKSGKKVGKRAKTGPRGFGQKIIDDDDDDYEN